MQTIIGTDVKAAATWLRAGSVVGIPTETVYGLAGNALSEASVLEIFRIKNRPSFNPLILHTHSVDALPDFVSQIPQAALVLLRTFAPGPLTLLLPKRSHVPDLVTAGSPLVAVRIPQHPLALQLLARIDFPLAAPSANPFTYISPTTAQHVAAQLGGKIPYILDGGACSIGIESTIIGFDAEEQPILHRAGGIAPEAIEQVLGTKLLSPSASALPVTPGQLRLHYAPHIPFKLGNLAEMLAAYRPERVGVLAFSAPLPTVPLHQQRVLAPSGTTEEAAQHLFAAMRELDAMDVDVILAEPVPPQGLGRAINDRLRRAAAERK